MAMRARYTVVDGEVVSELRNGIRKDYVPDPLGNTVALLDNTLTVTDSWEYWPYGETRSGSSATPFTFVGTLGYYKDTSTRTYVRARHYRQNLGRWLTLDAFLTSKSGYCYVLNLPVCRIDTNGLYVVDGPAPYTQEWSRWGRGITYASYCGEDTYHLDKIGPPCRGESITPPEPRDHLDRACQEQDKCNPPPPPPDTRSRLFQRSGGPQV